MERIESKDQLISYIAEGEKKPSDFKIGTEHEKFPFRIDKNKPVSYDGEIGIRKLLERASKSMDGNQFMKMKIS